MAESSIMEMFFGKKKRARRTSKTKSAGKKKKVIKKPKGLTALLKKKARKFRVKIRLTRNGKHIGYRKISHIKRDIRRKERAAKKKNSTTKPKRRRSVRRSSFGVGGSYMPLSNFMSPYPYSVDSSPPWV